MLSLFEAWKVAQPFPKFMCIVFVTAPIWFGVLCFVLEKLVDRFNLIERWFS